MTESKQSQRVENLSFEWVFSIKQTQALDILDDNSLELLELCYGGAKGGGKSVFLCRWLYLQIDALYKQFKFYFDKLKHPLPVAFMGRKQAKDFRDTTLETWKKFIPHHLYQLKEHDGEIIINNVKIVFGGLDSQESIKKFNSAEYAIIAIDQAEEINRDDYGMLKGTMRLKIDGHEIPKKLLLTANPADCFLRDDFVYNQNKLLSKKYLQALPSDNPFLSKDYIDNLKDAFKHRPELLEAYLNGDWSVLEGQETKVIRSLWVRDAVNRELRFNPAVKVTVSDIGAGGDDTVIYDMEGYKIIKTDISGEKDTMKTAGRILIHFNEFKSDLIIVDKCGLGLGVYDRLRELLGERRHLVLGINSAEKPTREEKEVQFANQRDEMWWHAGVLFSDCLTTIPNDEVLIQELCAPTYEIITSGGKIKVEQKKDIKTRIGRSTNRADTYIMGLFGQQFAEVKKNFHRTRQKTGRV